MDPQEPDAAAPADAAGASAGPSWAPDGRSVLVLAAGADGDYDALLSYTARGGDATRWEDADVASTARPASSPRCGSTTTASPCWSPTRRGRAGAPAPARPPRGRHASSAVKDFPALTGHELAAAGRHLALRRGNDATDDGPMVLLDTRRAQPRVRTLPSGVNPAWGSASGTACSAAARSAPSRW